MNKAGAVSLETVYIYIYIYISRLLKKENKEKNIIEIEKKITKNLKL